VQIKNRQQFLTILTITAVSLLAIDKIISPPLVKLWHDRSVRITQLHNQVKEGESLRNGRNNIRALWARMQASTLTNNTTLAEQQLFTGLNYWSQLSGISLNTVTPIWKQGSDPSYKTLECTVDAVGSLDRLSHFLYYLEKDPMALKLQNVELATRDADGTTIGLSMRVSGLVLTSKDQK
jgi:hypothetical protein